MNVSADFQIISSFCVTLLGAMLLLTAYFEAAEVEFNFEEIEDEEPGPKRVE